MSRAQPPRFWRRALERCLPDDVRDAVIGDLEEVYHQQCADAGERAAGRWYRREALSFAARFAWDTTRQRLARRPGREAGAARARGGTLVSWLDFKLGLRMLVRYPGLTFVCGLAMAFAIWVGAGGFEIVSQITRPSLPLPAGDRIVGIRLWDAEISAPEFRVAHDFQLWREQLRTVEQLGAFRHVERNVAVNGAAGEPMTVAEISAAAFTVTRVPPLLGRTLAATDEAPGAAPVVVIGHDVWQGRFAGDPAVVGRTVRVGAAEATVVGVMPRGYAFPVADDLWLPLRLDPLRPARLEGPPLRVFGRLADGATLEHAQAEIAALAQHAETGGADAHPHLRPSVVAYPRLIVDIGRAESLLIGSTNVFLLMLLVLICGNVALLMFARAATRESELVVRSALGASRRRIVTQLFAEALVLGACAAALGIGAAGAGVRWARGVAEAEAGLRLPFWFSGSLSTATLAYAVLLTLVGAAVAGITPGLRITRGLQSRLRETSAQGGNVRFGGVWTAVIVCQVAITVAFPVTSYLVWNDLRQVRSLHVAYPTERFLTARLAVDTDAATGIGLGDAYRELERRLAAEPAVEGVTFAERLPRMYHPHRLIELDEGDAAPLDPRWANYRVSSAAVDPRYFDVVGVDVRSGTGFVPTDAEAERAVVVVNESFVRSVMGGRNPVGRHLRYVHEEEWSDGRREHAAPRPWLEIIGVVPDMGNAWQPHDPKSAGIYHPITPDAVRPLHLAIRLRGDPAAFTPRLRQHAAAIDPSLRLADPQRLDDVNAGEIQFYHFWLRLTLGVSGVALLLSLAGIYAVMAFTVARRTREIGVRIALGANARRLVLSVLRRPLLQVGIGLCAGALLAGGLLLVVEASSLSVRGVLYYAAYACLMLGICALACAVPMRRALRVEPSEALRADA